MEVILQENVPSLGFVGDVCRVKPGYARNFLFPKRLALPASKHYVKMLEHQKKVLDIRKAEKQKDADELKKRVETVSLEIAKQATPNGKLFGSVGPADIHTALNEKGFNIDRKLVRIAAPIKATGEYDISLKLHQDVSASIKLTVIASEDSPKAEETEEVVAEQPAPAQEETTEAQAE